MRGRGRFHRGFGRRRGQYIMMRPALLFFMHLGSAHGYDLVEQLRSFGISDIDPSLVYRILRDMEGEGLIQSVWNEEKSQGPPRRVYSLTAEGNQRLHYYIEDIRSIRSQIDKLMKVYAEHMQNGSGIFHDKKGDE